MNKRNLSVLLTIVALVVSSCTSARLSSGNAEPVTGTNTAFASVTMEPSPSTTPDQPVVPIATPVPSATLTPSPTITLTPSPTPTRTPTPTATWIFTPAGEVVVPILLYHHISDTAPGNRYYVSTEDFRVEMESLYEWGYTTITPKKLFDVLVYGGELPVRPVVITFDDGNLDVYENAFPVMKELGFVGAIYIVANRLKAKDFISAEQLSEMAKAGWEIGSHGMSHIDLTQNHDLASYEILQSRLDIEEAVSVTVTSIAYPYGTVDSFVAQKVSDYGYYDAMGLGVSWRHTWGTLYYLNRREVHGDGSLTEFTALLPWSGPLGEFTPTPTATIIP